MMVFVLPIVLLLTVVSSQFCRDVNQNDLSFCAGHVNYPIDTNADEAILDSNAKLGSENAYCPYFASVSFQCRKFFQPCNTINITDPNIQSSARTLSSPIPTKQLIKICKRSCYYAQYAHDGLCKNLSPTYFKQECEQAAYYSDDVNSITDDSSNHNNLDACSDVDEYRGKHTGKTIWQIVLGSILGGVGAILLIWWLKERLVEYLRKRRLKEEDRIASEEEPRLMQQREVALEQRRQELRRQRENQNKTASSSRRKSNTIEQIQISVASSHSNKELTAVMPQQ